MGGGAMMRGMARLVGAATGAGTAAMVPSSSTGFCQAAAPEHLNVSSVKIIHKEGYGSVPYKPVVDARFLNPEDLEYSSDEDWGKISYKNLAFTPVPSEEEVEEATKELHAALHLSTSPMISEASEPTPVVENEQVDPPPKMVDQEKVVTEKPLPSLTAGLGLLAAGSSSVYQAFHLLQTNAKVQDAVKSLARDPAVWRAVLSNEKVQELTQTLHSGHAIARETDLQDEGADLNILKLTSKVCDFVTGKFLQVLNKVVEIVGSIFASVEKSLLSKESSSGVDKTVASCMMLAVAVLLVVAVKRVGK